MKFLHKLFAVVLIGFMSLGAMAQDKGTKDEAKALVEAAAAHVKKVGADQAFKDFTTDKANWTKKDLYVFVNDFKGNTVSHGANEKLIGKNFIEMKDQNGKFFIKDMGTLAMGKGVGWIEYDWVHPQTKKVDGKASYVIKLDKFDGYVGVGVYR